LPASSRAIHAIQRYDIVIPHGRAGRRKEIQIGRAMTST
jgi:hypothetical protein